jgi:drug/metabolite transporter (DMT)-like permease
VSFVADVDVDLDSKSPPSPPDSGARRELQLALVLMVLIWGANYTVVKVVLTELAPLTIAAVRVTLATFLLFVFSATRRSGRTGHTRLTKADWTKMALLGLTGVALNQLLFVTGLNRTVPSHSSLMVATGPIFVLLLTATFLDEPVGFGKVFGVLLSFAGVMALSLNADFTIDQTHVRGDITTLCAVLSFAVYTVAGKEMVRRHGALLTTAWSHLFGALILIPMALAVRAPNPAALTPKGIASLLYMAVFSSAIAYLIFYRGLREIGAAKVAALSYFQPLLAIIISISLGQEHLAARVIYGGALILTGVFVAEKG